MQRFFFYMYKTLKALKYSNKKRFTNTAKEHYKGNTFIYRNMNYEGKNIGKRKIACLSKYNL